MFKSIAIWPLCAALALAAAVPAAAKVPQPANLPARTAPATDGPLAPGKAAGVKTAESTEGMPIVMVGGIAAVVAIALSSGGGRHAPSTSSTTSTTSTTSTN